MRSPTNRMSGGRTRTRTLDPLIKSQELRPKDQRLKQKECVKPACGNQWLRSVLSNPRSARSALRTVRRAAIVPFTLAGTASPAAAAIFIHDGDLYLLGPDGGGFVIYNFVVIVVLLLAGFAAAWACDDWERAERYRRAEAEAWEAARYFTARAEETRRLTHTLDAETKRIEEEIHAVRERFEEADREEARRHESAKRALANRGERS